jgi:4-hydroxy-tetrahydrodipicolinate reductase
MAERPLRVVQWSVGNIGRKALRAVIEHPQMTLAGLYVSSPEKVGQDAGDLCGLPPVGIAATNSLDDIVALDADCVLYMRQGCDYDEVCCLLASGKNVVTTRSEFHHPASMDQDIRSKIEAACDAGGASIYSTGSSPGFVTEALVLPLISLQRRLDCLTIDEYADVSRRDSPEMIFQVMGFGAQPGPLDEAKLAHVRDSFIASLRQIGDAIGLPFDATTVDGEVAVVREDTPIAAGLLKAGTVAAQRITVTGSHGGKPVLRFRAHWYCATDLDRDWTLRETGWHLSVDGDTPMEVAITFPVALEDYAAVMPGYTAHRAVNSVAAVCAAAPGIRNTIDLPNVIATF